MEALRRWNCPLQFAATTSFTLPTDKKLQTNNIPGNIPANIIPGVKTKKENPLGAIYHFAAMPRSVLAASKRAATAYGASYDIMGLRDVPIPFPIPSAMLRQTLGKDT